MSRTDHAVHHDSPFAQSLQLAARGARQLWHEVKPLRALVREPRIVAHQYRGQLNGEHDRPLTLLYIGDVCRAHEFELFLGANAERDAAPPTELFKGRLTSYVAQRKKLDELAAGADLIVQAVFPFTSESAQDLTYHPFADGFLPVAPTLEQQIHRVRSRSYRRQLRELARRDDYTCEVESGADAIRAFWHELHQPYVLARFGKRGSLDDVNSLVDAFDSSGRLLIIKQAGRAVAGALIPHDLGGAGVLGYFRNGIADFASLSAKQLTERTGMLELALLRYAVEHRFTSIDLGFTRAIASDGRFIHKRRLGCTFAPILGEPRYLVRCKPALRPSFYARFALLTGAPGALSLQLGFDASSPTQSARVGRALLKSYLAPGVRELHLHTNAPKHDKARQSYESVVREVAADREVVVHEL